MHDKIYLTQESHSTEKGGIMKCSNTDLYYANVNLL